MSVVEDILYSPEDEAKEITSRIVKKSCSLKWRIENFSLYPKKGYGKILSPYFGSSSSSWVLELYPNGQNALMEGRIAVFLKKISPIIDEIVEYKIYLEDMNGVLQCLKEGEEIFSASRQSQRRQAAEIVLTHRREDILNDDNLIVNCQLTVWENIIEDTEHLNHHTSDVTKRSHLPKGIEIFLSDVKSLLTEHKNCDVTLQINDEKFPAHKLLLGARSSVFATIFAHGMKDIRSNIVTITDLPGAIVKDLLEYIYSGKVSDISVEKAKGLYAAAEKYALPELKEQCADFLQRNISVDNACDIATLADVHSDRKIIDSIKRVLSKNMSLLSTEKWKYLAQQNPRLAYEITLALTLDLSSS